ncbi:MAG: CBS domain-containing protein [Ferroplasma sp.]
MSLEIKNIMQKQPVYISEQSTIIDGAKKMHDSNKGSLLIGEPSILKGIVTERDIIKAIAEGKKVTDRIMAIATTNNLIFIDESALITKAAVLMSKHNIRHLIVKNTEGMVSGILSTRDLLRESYTIRELSNVRDSDWFGSD